VRGHFETVEPVTTWGTFWRKKKGLDSWSVGGFRGGGDWGGTVGLSQDKGSCSVPKKKPGQSNLMRTFLRRELTPVGRERVTENLRVLSWGGRRRNQVRSIGEVATKEREEKIWGLGFEGEIEGSRRRHIRFPKRVKGVWALERGNDVFQHEEGIQYQGERNEKGLNKKRSGGSDMKGENNAILKSIGWRWKSEGWKRKIGRQKDGSKRGKGVPIVRDAP